MSEPPGRAPPRGGRSERRAPPGWTPLDDPGALQEIPPPGEVHVWAREAALEAGAPAEASRDLSAAERERASRFLAGEARARFLAGRGLLRSVLASYAGLAPAEVRIAEGEGRKPRLAPGCGPPGLEFNASHSGALLVCAVAAAPVGVDVEEHRPIEGLERLVARFFATGERDAILAAPEEERLAAFFACWTRKEAAAKALGLGLAIGWSRFEVSASRGRPPEVLRAPLEARGAKLHLMDLDVGPAASGALAATRPIESVRRFWLEPRPPPHAR